MNEKITAYLEEILEKSFGLKNMSIKLETPPKKEMGDFAFGCFLLARDLQKSPNAIAQELRDCIESDSHKPSQIERLEVAWPYLNIFLGSGSFAESFVNFMQKENIYEDIAHNKEETVYIDYIGANVGKPLHIGHMCTPSQGQVFVNLFHKLWYNVVSDSHIGDWGIIFGKLIVAFEKYGDEAKLHENAVEHLFELYVRISADAEDDSSLEEEFRDAFKQLSGGDEAMKSIWAQFTKYSIESMNMQLSRIFVKPKYNIGESFYEWLGLKKMEDYPDLEYTMKDIVKELIKKWIALQNEDGSVGVVFPDEMKIPSCILAKRDGTHGYLASDLASIKYRMQNWNPEKILYFVDVRQQLHLKQAFTISRMAGWLDETTEITHAHNGFISLKDGAMSTRKWKIIKLEALLDEAEKRAADIIREKRDDIALEDLQKLSKIIGIWAIKYGYLKKSRETDVIFDWDEFMSFEGNSGPYIQYAYVRAQKILSKAGNMQSGEAVKYTLPEEKELIKHILEFPWVIEEISQSYYPHSLCQYVYDLTKKFSALYNAVPILTEEDEILRDSRTFLLYGFSRILEECFEILGIPLPQEM